MTAILRRHRLPVLAVAIGCLAGAALYGSLPVFERYVAGVLGLVSGVTPLGAGRPGFVVSLAVAFLVGLSMNFLPCNLPIVMSLLPSTTREGTRAWFLAKTALYGLGAVTVLGTLGAVLGLLGESLVPVVTAYPTFGVYVAGAVMGGVGLLSVLWGLREFGLLSLPRFPTGVTDALRGVADDREGAVEYVLLGAVYGGTSGGCPLPTYHLLLLWVVLAASPLYGAVVLGTYVLGRVVPIAVVGAVLRERPRRAASVFGGKYGAVRTVNGTVLVGAGTVLLVFAGLRAVVGGP